MGVFAKLLALVCIAGVTTAADLPAGVGDPDSFPANEMLLRGTGLSIQKQLFGWHNYATALSIVADDPDTNGHAGVDGGFYAPSNRGAYGQADKVGIYTQINAQPPLTLAAAVDAGRIYFKEALTPQQRARIVPRMQVHTNQWPYWISAIVEVSANGRSARIDQWVQAGDAANVTLGKNPADYPYQDRDGHPVAPAVKIDPVNNTYGQNTLVFGMASDFSDPSRQVGYELGCINPAAFSRFEGIPEESSNGCWGFESQATSGKGANAFITQGPWDVGYLALSGEVAGFLAAPSVFSQQGHGTKPAVAFQSNLGLHDPVLVARPVVSDSGQFPYGRTVELLGDGTLRLGSQAPGASATPAPALELFSAGGGAAAATVVATQGEPGRANSGNLNILANAVALRASVVITQHTPRSSAEACIPGQVASDDAYVYACSSRARWRRAALSDW